MNITLSEVVERLHSKRRPDATKNDVIIAARARGIPIVNGRVNEDSFPDLWFEVGYLNGNPRPVDA